MLLWKSMRCPMAGKSTLKLSVILAALLSCRCLPDGRVLLIRQFRPAIGEMIYEIPAGRLEPQNQHRIVPVAS